MYLTRVGKILSLLAYTGTAMRRALDLGVGNGVTGWSARFGEPSQWKAEARCWLGEGD